MKMKIRKATRLRSAEFPDMSAAVILSPSGEDLHPLDAVCEQIRRFVVMTPEQTDAVALWILHTWCFDAFPTSPRLRCESVVPAAGKSTVQAVNRLLVRKPVAASSITPSVIFRLIDAEHPTLLLDEAEAYIQDKDIRGLLNDGFARENATVLRTDPATGTVRPFSIWAPVAIAGIGDIHPTLESRCIRIFLQPKLSHEVVEHLSFDDEVRAPLVSLACELECWAHHNFDWLAKHRPTFPPELQNRQQDIWRPLFSIADSVSPEWGKRARSAALRLSADNVPAESLVPVLLNEIDKIFAGSGEARLPTVQLVASLNIIPDRPWSGPANAMSPHRLARILRPLGIKSKSIRLADGTTPKGYERAAFADALKRYPVQEID
jgi:putative DNA primase/helicase